MPEPDHDSPVSSSKPEASPTVSVIVRSIGRPSLAGTLDSLARQRFGDIEVLVVNAAGPAHPPVEHAGIARLRRIDGFGALARSAAANLGLDAATGTFAILLDDDDWFEPDHLERLVDCLRADRDAVAAHAGVHCYELADADSPVASGAGRTPLRTFDAPLDPVRLLAENTLPIHAVLFRRAVVERPPPCRFDPALDRFEDWDFWLQLAERGRFVRVDAVTAGYRIVAGRGFGVRVDVEAEALAALDAILAKWRSRWTPQQLRALVAAVRREAALAPELERLRAQLATSADAARALRAELGESEAAAEALRAELGRTEAEHERTRAELGRVEAERSRTGAELDRMLASRSWRLTAPLRAAARRLRAGRDRGAAALWSAAVTVYRFGPTARLARMLPFTFKRRLQGVLRQVQPVPPEGTFAGALPAQPLVSLLIPVYNHARYLEGAIRSALAQTYPRVEVIVVDDASNDPQVATILARLEGDPRLTVLHNESNRGISETQNRALIASHGELIGFLDCDDLLEPDAVETCLRYWSPDIVYSHSARVNVDADDREVNRISFEHLPRRDYFEENLEAMYATHFKMIRRDVFARVGLFDARFDAAQDYDMLMRIAFHYPSTAFVHVPHFVYRHRLHALQTTDRAGARQAQATATIQHEARLRRDIRAGRFERRVSFVMLSFGKHSQTLAALESLAATVRIPHEVILFDNGSDAQTVRFLRERVDGVLPNVRVVYSPTNLGPAGGRREALRHANGEWFVVFDNDELAEPGWFEELLVRASTDPRIGAVCCKVVFPNRRLQFSGGRIDALDDELIRLSLFDRDRDAYDLATAVFRDCDWCPIGATLFTVNPLPFLHEGYPNIFEDAAVSMGLRRRGMRLVNSPASWVWHEHVTFRPAVDMHSRYMRERYDPQRMLVSIASFRRENGLIIEDEYVWRENRLEALSREALRELLDQVALEHYPDASRLR